MHSRLNKFKRLAVERQILKALAKTGFKRSEIEELPHVFADRKPKDDQTYWYYNGPLDEKTRPFCKRLLQMDKVFSEEQINYISEELGYDVLQECGLYNCRHHWIKFSGRVIMTPPPTTREIRRVINDGIQV